MKYLKKYNESLEPTSAEINDIFNIEFEAYNFSVNHESYIPFESYKYPDRIMFNIYLCLDFQDNQEMVDIYNVCRHNINYMHKDKKSEIDILLWHITKMTNSMLSTIARKYDYTIINTEIYPLIISTSDFDDSITNIEKCDLSFDIVTPSLSIN